MEKVSDRQSALPTTVPLLTLQGSRGDALARFIWRYGVHLLLLFDGMMSAAVWLGITYLRHQSDRPINPIHNYQIALFFVVIWWWVSNALMDLYSRPLEITPLKQGKDLIWAASLFTMGLLSFAYLTKGSLDLGRSVVIPTCLLNPVCLFLSRSLVRWTETQLRRRGYGRVRTVLVGAGNLAERTWQTMQRQSVREHQVMAVLCSATGADQVPSGVPGDLLGHLNQLPDILHHGGIDQVVFADEKLRHQDILDLIAAHPEIPRVRFRIVCEDLSTVMVNPTAGVEEIDGMLLVHLGDACAHSGYEFLKRMLDLTVAVLLAPLCLLVCLVVGPLIWIKSGSSPFFWQKRVGLDGREFWMVKFRTMRPDVDEYGLPPDGPGDPRVLGHLGAWLRRSSLDEIPQLFNVLRGDMSLVGPRPEMPQIVAQYEPWQRRRLAVVPGVTGLWQILGRKNLPLQSNLEYDFYYIQNRSFLLDLVILIRTIPVVLLGKGAY